MDEKPCKEERFLSSIHCNMAFMDSITEMFSVNNEYGKNGWILNSSIVFLMKNDDGLTSYYLCEFVFLSFMLMHSLLTLKSLEKRAF